jgi:Lon protease-like protein
MSTDDHLSELPLFPLGTVLFPDGLLPLRIFEVRYLDMIARCHKSGSAFGVVGLTRGSEVRSAALEQKDSSESFHSVGTLARIVDYAAPQAGLLVIRCQGDRRFSVKSSHKLRHGLWVADAQLLALDRVMPIPEDLQHIAQGLRKLLEQLRQRDVPPEQIPLIQPYRFDDCDWVANRWCELLPIPLDMKQGLMALDNPLLRLELVSDLLDKSGWA